MVLLGTLLAHRILGAPASSEVLEQANQDLSAIRLAENVERSLFAPDDVVEGNDQSHRFFLRARERLSDKLSFCTRLAFMPTEEDHVVFPLPRFLAPLHYPLHALRVLGKYGAAPLKVFR